MWERYTRKQATGNECRFEKIVKKSLLKNLCEVYKEWTEAGVSASGATTHRHLEKWEARI